MTNITTPIPLTSPRSYLFDSATRYGLISRALHWLTAAILALVIGHVAMALIHRFAFKDKVLSRMAGPINR